MNCKLQGSEAGYALCFLFLQALGISDKDIIYFLIYI